MFDSPDAMVAFLKGADDPAYNESIRQIEESLVTTEDEPEQVLVQVK